MDQYRVVASLSDRQVDDLMGLYSEGWWATTRVRRDVEAMLVATDVIVGLVEDGEEERLVGFARVLTDGQYLAVVLDVMVSADHQGQSLGARLMDAIVTHPKLISVNSVELVCQPELVDFYERWGFSINVGRSQLMRRTRDPALSNWPTTGANGPGGETPN